MSVAAVPLPFSTCQLVSLSIMVSSNHAELLIELTSAAANLFILAHLLCCGNFSVFFFVFV